MPSAKRAARPVRPSREARAEGLERRRMLALLELQAREVEPGFVVRGGRAQRASERADAGRQSGAASASAWVFQASKGTALRRATRTSRERAGGVEPARATSKARPASSAGRATAVRGPRGARPGRPGARPAVGP